MQREGAMSKLAVVLVGILVLALIGGAVACGGDETTPTPAATGTPGGAPTPTVSPVTLKLTTSAPVGTPRGGVYFHFEELVEQYTEGRVLIDIYPGSQLFPTTEEWEAVVTGSVDIYGDSSYYVSQAVPDVMISYIDGLWESYEHAYAVMEESELPRIMAEKVEDAGPVKMLGWLPGGMVGCVMNTVRETRSLSDLEGFRCQGSPGSPPTPLYDYTGMASIPIAYEEVVIAFTQGIVDAVQYPPTAMTTLGLDEIGKHALFSPAAWFFMTAMVINEDSWERLTPADQDILVNIIMPEMYEYAKTVYREDEQRSIETIEQNMDTAHWVPEDEYAVYREWVPTHSMTKVQLLMVDPRILEIIEEYRPSAQ
jgi:C4-dicarboxylate-binding protein DctP